MSYLWKSRTRAGVHSGVMSGGDGYGEPGVAEQGGVDGVDGAQAVVARGGEVAADAAVAGERGGGVPVSGDSLMSLRGP
jgi:hypothetical protein